MHVAESLWLSFVLRGASKELTSAPAGERGDLSTPAEEVKLTRDLLDSVARGSFLA